MAWLAEKRVDNFLLQHKGERQEEETVCNPSSTCSGVVMNYSTECW